MTDTDDSPGGDSTASDERESVSLATQIGATYKVLGQFAAADGAAVIGRNDATSGTPIGVEGTVPNASSGYGLATADDARIEGALDTNETDFVVSAGTAATADGRNVVLGHESNTVESDVVGATIGGGGALHEDAGDDTWHSVSGDYGTIAGGYGNTVSSVSAAVLGGEFNTADAFDATVCGGLLNDAFADESFVGGGFGNDARGLNSVVVGGQSNVVRGDHSTVGGGEENRASGTYTTIGGGGPTDKTDETAIENTRNVAADDYSTVGGGGDNQAGSDDGDSESAPYATVPGGRGNTASGAYSFAAGRGAEASHDGAFVLGDSSSTPVSSSNPDELRSQVPIYAPSVTQTSARAEKTNVEPVDPAAALDGVESLAVSSWEFADSPDDARHVGPMAEEFAAAFDLADDGGIASVDADGVLFAAVQALSAELDETQADLADTRAELAAAREAAAEREERIDDLVARVAALESRGDSTGVDSAATDD